MVQPLRSSEPKSAGSCQGSLAPKRILVDATYTLVSGRHSGIERVVNNLRVGSKNLVERIGSEVESLLCFEGDFYRVGDREENLLSRVAATQADVTGCLPGIYRRIVQPLIGATRSVKLRQWFLPEPGHLGVFKLPHRYWNRRALKGICGRSQKIEPEQGDLLVLPDAYWARKEVWRAAESARARGAFVAVLVYDMIPLTHPEFVGQRRTQRFGEYLRQVATQADLILTISETVRRELMATLPKLMGEEVAAEYCKNIESFPLGAEFSESQGKLRPELVPMFESRPSECPYLMVAAFDPRKNHRYLLDAFDLFWQTHPYRKLCLVGRVGSRCEDVMERIRNHPRLGKQLFSFHDLSDGELQYCYRHARGVIFPSIVEGFGLPIVESLWHGQRTFASDTPIHREVGGENCQYFDLASPESLVQLLTECENRAHVRLRAASLVRPYSWSQSTQIFFDHCLSAYQQYANRAKAA